MATVPETEGSAQGYGFPCLCCRSTTRSADRTNRSGHEVMRRMRGDAWKKRYPSWASLGARISGGGLGLPYESHRLHAFRDEGSIGGMGMLRATVVRALVLAVAFTGTLMP